MSRTSTCRTGAPGPAEAAIQEREIRWPADSPAAVALRLEASQACDSTDALPDLRPPGRVDGAFRPFFGLEGCRAAGAAPGGRGAAAAESETEAGRPGRDAVCRCQVGWPGAGLGGAAPPGRAA